MTFTHLPAVIDEVAGLADGFRKHGHRLYLVGGIVRDQWLDLPLDAGTDIDLTTDARPAAIKQLVAPLADALWTQGERFGTIGLQLGRRAVEITTHRAEVYDEASRKPTVAFGDDITDDLSRRDFTVNAMAIEVPDGSLVDPFGGVDDLETSTLRTPLSPAVSFGDDPLRMLRAARFATKYDLVPDPGLVHAMATLRSRLAIVAIERIGDELERLLALDDPSRGLRLLAETGVLAEVVGWGEPAMVDELRRDPGLPQRVDDGIRAAAALAADWRRRVGALGLAVFDDVDGVAEMVRRLRLSNEDRKAVLDSVGGALGLLDLDADHAESRRRWLAATVASSDAIALARALVTVPRRWRHRDGRDIDDIVAALEAQQLDDGEPMLLRGDQILAVLGVEPGPVIGEAMRMLQERYFADGPTTEQAQRAALKKWWADRGSPP